VWVTPEWVVGGDLVAVSNQIYFGDEGNDNPPLDGYAKVDLRTAYNVTENVQIYSMVDNVFDNEYGLFGLFYNRAAANNAASADPSIPANYFTNPQSSSACGGLWRREAEILD
jgi:outer membrane receptor for ferric coprogen and ferric-rhodotorulic acid